MKAFIDLIKTAATSGHRVRIRGGGSKDFLRPLYAQSSRELDLDNRPIIDLHTGACTGIGNYQASELVMTVNAGTPLAEVEAVLAQNNQMLPFEPPSFVHPEGLNSNISTAPSITPTIGGAVASALSGPRALMITGVRDFVLGVRVIDGQGNALRFGGEVMKNVAGYDVSRLMCGARGTLGVLTEVSLKVLPRPSCEVTLIFDFDATAAHLYTQSCLRTGVPVSAASWRAGIGEDADSVTKMGQLHLRLSATTAVLDDAMTRMNAPFKVMSEDTLFWNQLKNHQHEFFTTASDLWRVRCARADAEIVLPHDAQFDSWHEAGGEIRWLRPRAKGLWSSDVASKILRDLREVGRVQVWRSSFDIAPRNTPLSDARARIEHNIRRTFDPHSLFI